MTIDMADMDMLLCVDVSQIQPDDLFMFQRTPVMTGPKKKVMRRFLPHEPERESSASDSESTESDSYDDADYAPVYDSDEFLNEDEWEMEG